jgi:hypothetical protein
MDPMQNPQIAQMLQALQQGGGGAPPPQPMDFGQNQQASMGNQPSGLAQQNMMGAMGPSAIPPQGLDPNAMDALMSGIPQNAAPAQMGQ